MNMIYINPTDLEAWKQTVASAARSPGQLGPTARILYEAIAKLLPAYEEFSDAWNYCRIGYRSPTVGEVKHVEGGWSVPESGYQGDNRAHLGKSDNKTTLCGYDSSRHVKAEDHVPLCMVCEFQTWPAGFRHFRIARDLQTVQLLSDLLPYTWQRECEIIPNWTHHALPDDQPKCVVAHIPSGNFLRYSKGPGTGTFWDMYGDDFLRVGLAVAALSKAQPPSTWKVTK